MEWLKKIYTTFNNKILFNPDAKHPSIEEQKDFLQSFSDPQNDYERSFYKYKCVEFYYYNKTNRFILNLMSVFALLFFIPFYWIKGLRYNSKFNPYVKKDTLVCKASKRIPTADIFPQKLKEQYGTCLDAEEVNYAVLALPKVASKIYFKAFFRHLNRPHYLLVLLVRLAQDSYLLAKHQPSCLVTYVCEKEFADPLVTLLCESLGIKYEGFMHGDYLYSVEKAFMHYSTYWVWDNHYKEMFHSLRCSQNMEVYLPIKYSGIAKQNEEDVEPEYFLTYYCSNETRESMDMIHDVFVKLEKKGKKCKLRPHPRFSDIEYIKLVFDESMIESPNEVSIADSIKNTYYSVAVVSTVLSQAYYSGKKVIIDDYSRKDYFEIIKKSDYIMLNKADMFLSELVTKITRE